MSSSSSMNLLRKTLITAALPYANWALHFGHMAGAYLPADIFARYCRLKGRDTLFICGSDEHGVAITMSAELAGRTPQEQVDHFHLVNQDLFKKCYYFNSNLLSLIELIKT